MVDEITLPLDYAATTLFEIPLGVVLGAVPAPLSPVEVRPGVGLVSLTVCGVKAGGVHGAHGPLPAYAEAVWCVHVEPDLSQAVPDLSILVLCFAATHLPALTANADHHQLCVYPTPIQVEIERQAHRVHISDAQGPIASLSCAPEPRYSQRPATLQVYTLSAGEVRRYDERFVASSYKHQRRTPCAQMHEHPFFQGVPVQGLTRPFMQWLCDPGAPITQIATAQTRALGVS